MQNKHTQQMYEYGKIPPQAIEIEESILGALMLEGESINLIDLQPDDFYKECNQKIFNAIMQLSGKSKIDMLTVTEQLRKNGELDEIGGAYYITCLTAKISGAAHIETHALIVKEKSTARKLISMSSEISERAFNETDDISDLIDFSNSKIEEISNFAISKNENIPISDAAKEALDTYYLRKKLRVEGKTFGVSTGIPSLNAITSGWQGGWCCILAARPAMGKTSVMLHHAKLAAKDGTPVVIYSLEMTRLELTNKLIMSECNISSSDLISGRLSEQEEIEFERATGVIYDLPIHIVDKSGMNISQIKNSARQLKKRGKCGIVFIDYLQLMTSASKNKSYSRENEVSEISKSIKGMAKDLDIPVMALSQLSRQCEDRPDKRPRLSDLRESGSIEQDADIVCFLYRPDYYNISEYDGMDSKGLLIYHVAKFRHGGLGEIKIRHNPQMNKFNDLDYPDLDKPF